MADSLPSTKWSEWKVDADIEPAAGPSILPGRIQQILSKLRVSNKATTIFDGPSVLFSSSFIIFYLNISNSVGVLRARTDIKKISRTSRRISPSNYWKMWQRKRIGTIYSTTVHHTFVWLGYPDHILRLEVFLKPKGPSETRQKESDKSVNGVRCSRLLYSWL